MFDRPVTVGELLIVFALLAVGYAVLAWWAAGRELSEAEEELEAMADTYQVTHRGPAVVELKKQ